MADHQPVGGIYVYRGGRAPNNITHAIIDKSVKVIDEKAFYENENLLSVETHDELEEIESMAFCGCVSLTHLDIRSVIILDSYSLADTGLTEVDCDNLEIINDNVFTECASLRRVAIPKVKRIKACAFEDTSLTDVEFSETLEFVEGNAFYGNDSLRRICLPLKADLFHEERPEVDEYFPNDAFDECDSLATVELIGGIHETVSSLHMKRWRNHMTKDINQINVTLPRIPSAQKTNVIRWWLQSVQSRIEHYKTKHIQVLKEATVLLELALWKAKLDDDEGGDDSLEAPTKKVKIDVGRARNERRVTSGANIVIKNILPFLKLK